MKLRNLAAGLTAAALALTAAPVYASDPDNVMPLVDAITSTGTKLYTQCKEEVKFMGAYVSSARAMAICSKHPSGLPTAFTPQEQDTLRHEGIHLAQDCMDRQFNSELETTRTLINVMRMMGAASSSALDFEKIELFYRNQGADDVMIMLEFEAWAGAAVMSNKEVAHLVRTICRTY